MNTPILVVDDDPLICKGLKFNLSQSGYDVVTAMTSAAALDQVRHKKFELAILDIGLPGEDGLGLCRHLKEIYHLPVLFLTARRRELDEIVGLEIGGDDYITKPFNLDLLLAHIKALLRRTTVGSSNLILSGQEPVQAGGFTVDRLSHRAIYGETILELAPREFDLLYFFVSHPDQVFAATEIVDSVWGSEYIGEPQVLYVQIRSLREKIEDDPSNPIHLLTLRGLGYKFIP